MSFIENIKGGLSTAGLKVKEYSPEILTGLGIVSIVAGVVLTSRATLKIHESLCPLCKESEDSHLDISKSALSATAASVSAVPCRM